MTFDEEFAERLADDERAVGKTIERRMIAENNGLDLWECLVEVELELNDLFLYLQGDKWQSS